MIAGGLSFGHPRHLSLHPVHIQYMSPTVKVQIYTGQYTLCYASSILYVDFAEGLLHMQ